MSDKNQTDNVVHLSPPELNWAIDLVKHQQTLEFKDWMAREEAAANLRLKEWRAAKARRAQVISFPTSTQKA